MLLVLQQRAFDCTLLSGRRPTEPHFAQKPGGFQTPVSSPSCSIRSALFCCINTARIPQAAPANPPEDSRGACVACEWAFAASARTARAEHEETQRALDFLLYSRAMIKQRSQKAQRPC